MSDKKWQYRLLGPAFDPEWKDYSNGLWVGFAPLTTIEWREVKPPVKVGDVISDEDVLDGLPVGAVVLDKDSDAWQHRYHTEWYVASAEDVEFRAEYILEEYGPVTVIHVGEPE